MGENGTLYHAGLRHEYDVNVAKIFESGKDNSGKDNTGSLTQKRMSIIKRILKRFKRDMA